MTGKDHALYLFAPPAATISLHGPLMREWASVGARAQPPQEKAAQQRLLSTLGRRAGNISSLSELKQLNSEQWLLALKHHHNNANPICHLLSTHITSTISLNP